MKNYQFNGIIPINYTLNEYNMINKRILVPAAFIGISAAVTPLLFEDKEVLQKDFIENVVDSFQTVRPYFDYMSEVLTTNLNGESLI